MYLDPTPWEVNQSTLETLASISDELTNDPSPAGIRSTFQQETLSVVKNNSFMGLWQLFAAAQIFRCCLVSIYPDLGWSALQDIHNRTITPPSAVTNRPPIHLCGHQAGRISQKNTGKPTTSCQCVLQQYLHLQVHLHSHNYHLKTDEPVWIVR